MDLSTRTIEAYLRNGFGQFLDVADRLGDAGVNERPHGPATNSVAALIVHCCGVTEFWLGHVALARPTTRDREPEFRATADLQTLHQLVDATITQALADCARLEAGGGCDEGGRQFLLDGDTTDASVVLHVLEELYQHLGHAELTADALGAPPAPRSP